MSIMFLNIRSVSRGRGGSAIAKAAYIARDRLTEARTGRVHDYRQIAGLAHTEIILPPATPATDAPWARDRSTLWNTAESAERRRNARVAREYTIALPHELPAAARLELAREFARGLAARYGTPVDLAVHRPTARGDPRNHHAHILAATRELAGDGFGKKASIELDTRQRRARGLSHVTQEFRALRVQWAELANEKLREANIDARLEPRSRATLAREHVIRAHEHAHSAEPELRTPVPAPSSANAATAAPTAAPLDGSMATEAAQQRAAQAWLAYRAGEGRVATPRSEHERDHAHDAGLGL